MQIGKIRIWAKHKGHLSVQWSYFAIHRQTSKAPFAKKCDIRFRGGFSKNGIWVHDGAFQQKYVGIDVANRNRL
jgi:Cu2+-containing amine oxidase